MPPPPPPNPVLALAEVVRATGHGDGWAGRMVAAVVAQGLAERAELEREPPHGGGPPGRRRDAAGEVSASEGPPPEGTEAEAGFDGGVLRLRGVADPPGAPAMATALAAIAEGRRCVDLAEAEEARARALDLTASEERFRMIAEHASDVITRNSLDGRFTWVSPSLEVVLGYEPGDWLGRLPREFVHPDDAESVISARPELLAEPDRTVVRTFRMRHVGGGYRRVEAASRWFSGSSRDIVVVFRDVSRRVEAEREDRALLAADASTGRRATAAELAAVLAHELNQPLAALTNFAAVVARLAARAGGDPGAGAGEADPDRLIAAARRTHEEALRAQEIVARVREFVRQKTPRRVPVSLPELLREAARSARLSAEAAGVRLEVRAPPPPEGTRFEGDPVLLRQVLVNLLANAVQAAAGGGVKEVTLSGAADADRVTLRVDDTGPRLRERDLDRFFEPFHSTRPDGVGLGLVISRSIVRAHGGTLRVVAPPTGPGLALVAELPRTSIGRPPAFATRA